VGWWTKASAQKAAANKAAATDAAILIILLWLCVIFLWEGAAMAGKPWQQRLQIYVVPFRGEE